MTRWVSRETGLRALGAVVMIASLAALGRVVGVASPGFAVIASFCLLGLLDLAMPLIRIRMPRFLRRVRLWERQGHAYRALGVPAFGELLRRTPLRGLNRRVYLKRSLGDLGTVRIHLENAEAAHFWGAVATIPYLAIAGWRGWWLSLASVVLFNVTVNVYPCLHLRAVRARVDDVMGKRSARRGSAPAG